MRFIYWALTFAFISQMTVDKVDATKSLQVITLHYIHLAEAFIRSDFPWVHSTKWIQVESPVVKENQTERYNLLTFFDIYSIENRTKTAYLMFYPINFMIFESICLFWMGYQQHISKKLGREQQKTRNVGECSKKHLFGTSHR